VKLSAIFWACAALRPSTAFLHTLSVARPIAILVRLYSTGGTLTAETLCERARDFIRHKNAAGRGDATLDPVFDMCSPDVDLYGLTGDEVRPGLTAFFVGHKGIQHELIDESMQVVGPRTVQYAFVKSWQADDGEMQRWSSMDPTKPRNKVERLDFDNEGMLARVSVVSLD
jgi:hypothetical protein